MSPGIRIQTYREQRGMTVRELAALASMRPEFLESIEGGMPCHHKTLEKIADHLGVTLGMILGEELSNPNVNLEDEVAPEYRTFVRVAVRLALLLGSWVMVFGFILVVAAAEDLLSRLLHAAGL